VGHDVLSEIVRKVLLTYWNTASFLVLYANAGGWTLSTEVVPVAERPLLDRWMLSELHAVTRDVTGLLEAFDTASAGRRLAGLIDDLSNWYVRRSRRRFWDGPASAGGAPAFATLYECVSTLTLLLAPFVPFVTDYVWGALRRAEAPESVHLASWPAVDTTLIDQELSGQMALARRLVELGRSARSGASVRTRQPLRRALIGAGLGLAASMLVLGAGLLIFRGVYLNSVPNDVLPANAAATLFDTLVRFIKEGLRTILVAGLVIAAGAFLTGPSVSAVTTRRAITSGLAWVRQSGEHAGLRTGPAGTWTYTHRRGLRISAVALAALLFVFAGQPSVALVIVIVAALLVVLGLIELLGSRPPARPATP